MSDAVEQTAAAEGFNLFSQSGPARMRMSALEPTLQRINDRFARYLRATLLQHLGRGVTVVAAGGIQLVEHRELMEQLPTPTHLTLLNMKPLRGPLVLSIDASLVMAIVESRFGGNGRFPINNSNREFTPFELKSMRRVVETTLEQFSIAWEPLGRFEVDITRQESNPQFAGFATSDELIIVSTFDVTVDQGKGRLATFIPYSGIEPLQDQLTSGIVADAVDFDLHWSETLQQRVEQAAITLNVELGTIEISVGDLVALSPGNVFEMDRPEVLVVEASGIPLFRGRWGKHGRKIGILVEERVGPAVDALARGHVDRNTGDV